MKHRVFLCSLLTLILVLERGVECADAEDVKILLYDIDTDAKSITLYLDLSTVDTEYNVGQLALDSPNIDADSSPTDLFDLSLVKKGPVTFPFSTELAIIDNGKINLILTVSKKNAEDPENDPKGYAHFTKTGTFIDGTGFPDTANYFTNKALSLSFPSADTTKINSIFTLLNDMGNLYDNAAKGKDETIYVEYTEEMPDNIYLCLKDTATENVGIPNCDIPANPITISQQDCNENADIEVVCTSSDVSSKWTLSREEVPVSASIMLLNEKLTPSWTSAPFELPNPVTPLKYTFIDTNGVCTKGDFNVLDMTPHKVDNFLEVYWSVSTHEQEKRQYNLKIDKDDDDTTAYLKESDVDCRSDDIETCFAYYFPAEGEEVPAVTWLFNAFDGEENQNEITKQEVIIPAKNQQREITTMDIITSNFSNRKNSEVCVFDKLMPNTNSSEFSYELVVANSEGAWKKYSSYTKKDQSLCFSIQLPADKFMPNSQIHLAAIKRDVKKRSISSSSYVRTFVAEPKVKLLNADVAKVELEGVGHKFLIRDAETHKIITRDVQKKGLEAYIRVDQKNGGVSNKEFIMEMRDGRMVSRVQFKTPEYKAVSE